MLKLLIVDDSFFARQLFSDEAKKISGVEVAATARNGIEALKVLRDKDIDLITLDIKMPEMDGVEVLEKMNEMKMDIPVIVVSSLTPENSDMAGKVLELGAVDVLSKISDEDEIGPGVAHIKEEFNNKIKAFVQNEPDKKDNKKVISEPEDTLRTKLKKNKPELLIIGGSTGAPPVIHSITSQLPADFPLPVVIIQHMQELFLEGLASNISQKSNLPVNLVTTSRKLKRGNIYIPGHNKHIRFGSGEEGDYVRLKAGEPVSGACPSVEVAFQSAAEVFGDKVIAVLLTGMGRDGADGTEKLYQEGALCLGQDKETSVVYGMPGEAAALGAFDLQAPAEKIPMIINDWAKKTTKN